MVICWITAPTFKEFVTAMEVIISDRPFCNGCWVHLNDEQEVIKKRLVSSPFTTLWTRVCQWQANMWTSKENSWSLASCPWTTLMENGVSLFPHTISCPLVHRLSQGEVLTTSAIHNVPHVTIFLVTSRVDLFSEEHATCHFLIGCVVSNAETFGL